jgi:hypothetical protein
LVWCARAVPASREAVDALFSAMAKAIVQACHRGNALHDLSCRHDGSWHCVT